MTKKATHSTGRRRTLDCAAAHGVRSCRVMSAQMGGAEVSTDLTALIVAVVGVAGTLTAPIVSQRLALRTRQQELDAEHRRRFEERDDERLRAELGERRAAYIELIAAVRAFRRTIRNHVLEPTQHTRAEMAQARAAFDRSHAESQLIASKAVLQAATSTATALVAAYHSATGTKEHSPDTPQEFDAAWTKATGSASQTS